MSFHSDLVAGDLLSEWKPLIDARKYFVNPEDDKIYAARDYGGTASIDIDRPWIYTHNNPHAFCDWWHDIESTFKFIPTPCLNCWKVVVRPRNLDQLFKLYILQMKLSQEDPECYCKCGIERRAYVFGNYGGYFYNQGKEAGLIRYKMVRDRVIEELDARVPVVLKRYCTEYELKYGPSDKYEQPQEAARWEHLIEEQCVMIPSDHVQPDNVRRRAMREWIKYAWSIADPTVFEYTDGAPLVPPPVTYHGDLT